jgi:hypothetical protein
MKNKRNIPIISFNELELKKKKPQVYKSLVEGITEAFKTQKKEIKLCEVKHTNTFVTVHKDMWSGSLANAMNYYIEKEEYEECSKIKKLIEKIK